MAYDRERALRLVVEAMKPHLDVSEGDENPKSTDETMTEILATLEAEPSFGAAFDAAVKAVWDAATYYALNP